MKRIYSLVLVLFFKSMYMFAQVPEPSVLFMEAYHGNGTEQINTRSIPTFDNGFILGFPTASQTGSFANACTGYANKIVLNKYLKDGYSIEWQKCYVGNPDSSYGLLFPQIDGSFVLGGATGLSSGPTGRDFLIRKEDGIGSTIWSGKRYGGSGDEHIQDMIQLDDGGFIVLAKTNSNDGDVALHFGSQFTFDIWVIKLNSEGDKIWSAVLGGTNDDYPACVVPIPNGGCYVLGYTLSTDQDCLANHGNSDVFIARLDSSGNKIWTKCLGGTGFDGTRGSGISIWAIPDDIGGALITASTNSTNGDVSNLIGKGDFWLLSIDSTSNILWNKCFGGPTSDEFPKTLCKATDGTLWIGGVSTNVSGMVAHHYGKDDAWLVHVDSNGGFLSAAVFGGPDHDELTVLQPLENGLVLAGGTYRTEGGTMPDTFAGGDTDIFLARIAPWTTNIKNHKDLATKDKLLVFPNPTNNILYIQFGEPNEIRSLNIFDISGKLVYKNNILPAIINVTNWPIGVYEVLVWTDEDSFSTKIIIAG